jgi:hypothetical protein
MVDGVILLVDAAEGPLPQTKFVTMKALALGLRPIVVINKCDRPDAQPHETHDAVFDLFAILGAQDDQLDFPTLFASSRQGWAVENLENDEHKDLAPMFDLIVEHVHAPRVQNDAPFSMLITTLEYDNYLGRASVGPVDLVDDDDRPEAERQRLHGDELGLRQRPFGRVHQQDHAVHHVEDALDLAAEIGVAGRIDDVDAGALPVDRGALGEDGDAALALQVVRVHDPFHDLLVGAEGAALLQQLVDQGGLAVVDVGDDGDVTQLHDRDFQTEQNARRSRRARAIGSAKQDSPDQPSVGGVPEV